MTSDAGSNILIYLTGHGGDEFLKFQSQEDIMSKVTLSLCVGVIVL